MERSKERANSRNYQTDSLVMNKKFSSRMQARLLLVFCVIILLLVGLMGRLIYLLQTDGERYEKQVLSREAYVSAVLPYKRGDILDRNGTVLARSELMYRLILDPKRLLLNEESIEPTIKALEDQFQIDENEIRTVLKDKADSQYVILKKNVLYEDKNAFEGIMEEDKSKIKCVWFEEEYVRSYPYNTLASDVLGFTSADNIGYYGIEEYYNEELNGTNGREYGYYDSSLNIERIVEKAQHGNSIVSTIDINVQRIIQKHIKEFNTEYGSKKIGILIMDPNNGEIFAMASNQEYDLNNPRDLKVLFSDEEINSLTEEQKMEALNMLWKNDVISSGFEPGSTFKPFTVASALEEAIISDNSTFFCDGAEHYGGVTIRCNKRTGHGELTLGETIMKSCNDAMMQIAELEGRNLFFQYQNSFNFGKKTGIDLPGEETGLLIDLDQLNVTELATSSFGQSMNVTMLQMAAAYSSLVNGGNYYVPHTVKQIINNSGATVKQFDKVLVRQTVSEETSKLLQEYLYQTVEAGTAKPAKVEGYAIGGKTGTAQKFPRDAKTYVVSFLGAAPAINPEIVIYVMIDEPQNVLKQDDSSLATGLANRVLNEVLPVLGIFPEGEIDYLIPEEDESNEAGDIDNQVINNEDQGTDNEGHQDNDFIDNVNPQTEDNNEDQEDTLEDVNNSPGNSQEDNSNQEEIPSNSNNEESDTLDDNSQNDEIGTEGTGGGNASWEDEYNGEAIGSNDE